MRETTDAGAIDKVAALGMAGHQLVSPLATRDGARWEIPPRDQLAGVIAPLLLRARAAGDQRSARELVVYFAAWLEGLERFAGMAELQAPWRMEALAGRVVWEWLHDRCPGCRGTGLQERIGKGGRRAPTQFGRGLQHVSCKACNGTKKARVHKKDRAKCLALPIASYHAEHWPQIFAIARAELLALKNRITAPLHAALGRRTIRVNPPNGGCGDTNKPCTNKPQNLEAEAASLDA